MRAWAARPPSARPEPAAACAQPACQPAHLPTPCSGAGLESLALPIDAFQELIRLRPSPLAACTSLHRLRLGPYSECWELNHGRADIRLAPGDAEALAALLPALPALRLLEIEARHERSWRATAMDDGEGDDGGQGGEPGEAPSEQACACVAPAEAVAALRRAAPGLEIRLV